MGETPRTLVRRHKDDHMRSRAGTCTARRRKNIICSTVIMAGLLRLPRRGVKIPAASRFAKKKAARGGGLPFVSQTRF
jgi:hypothetical protein